MITAKMKWAGGMKFEGESTFGHKIVTDGSRQAGGEESGYKPTELMFYGLAGCAGIDVVNIMKKMRQKLTSLDVEVIAHQNEEFPRPFHTVEVRFIARGDNLDESKLAKAIELSEEKYCAVSQTISNAGKVTTSYEIVNT